MADRYANFAELSVHEVEGRDYVIESQDRGTDFVIMGIHGGRIEPVTAEIVRAIAGEKFSYYLFMGQRSDLHITSSRFDEPVCVDLVSKSKSAITIHGKEGREEFVMLGGLDGGLINKIEKALTENGFVVLPTGTAVTGAQPENVCNRGFSGKGLQVEVSRGLRDLLYRETTKMQAFAKVMRSSAS